MVRWAFPFPGVSLRSTDPANIFDPCYVDIRQAIKTHAIFVQSTFATCYSVVIRFGMRLFDLFAIGPDWLEQITLPGG
jgi:hypothetical protein